MCCKLQVHVKIHAIIMIVGSGLGILFWIFVGPSIGFLHDSKTPKDIKMAALYLSITLSLLHLFIFFSALVCLVGAIKRKRFYLVPFMISQVLLKVIFLFYSLPFIAGLLFVASFFGVILWFLLLCMLECIPIYILYTTVKFYQEIKRSEQSQDSAVDENYDEEETYQQDFWKRYSTHSL